VWRQPGSYHETRSDEGAILLAIYRKPNVFGHTSGFGVEAPTKKEPVSAE
jgi:hypothetical protein